jgi:fibronectin type 3 domain-containing protein
MVALLVATPLLARQHTSGNISLSTTTLSFNGSSGNVSSQPLTITSTGRRSVTIQNISFSNGVFSGSAVSLPATLSPGQTLTVKVIAKPQSTAQTGTLTVTSTANDPTVSLSETAISTTTSHSVSLTWHAPSSSSDPVDSYQVDRAASGSTQYSTIGTTVASSTAFTDTSVTSGHTYVYEVRSVDQSGNTSNPSNTITMTIP